MQSGRPPLINPVKKLTESDQKVFNAQVLEYETLTTKLRESFTKGIIEIGKTLHNVREYWKERGLWKYYLDEIRLSYTSANQMIRLFEYAKDEKNLDIIDRSDICNWERLHKFLALPDEAKKHADEIFNEADIINSEEVIAIDPDKKLFTIPKEIQEFDQNLQTKIERDIERNKLDIYKLDKNSEELVKMLSESKTITFDNKSLYFCRMYLIINYLIDYQKIIEKNYSELSKETQEYWKARIGTKLHKLNTEFKLIF